MANIRNETGADSVHFSLANNTATYLSTNLRPCKIGVETDTGLLGYKDHNGTYRKTALSTHNHSGVYAELSGLTSGYIPYYNGTNLANAIQWSSSNNGSLTIGTGTGSTANPSKITLSANYADDTTDTKAKFMLYNGGTGAVHAIGVSSAQTNYYTSTSGSHAFFTANTQRFTVDNSYISCLLPLDVTGTSNLAMRINNSLTASSFGVSPGTQESYFIFTGEGAYGGSTPVFALANGATEDSHNLLGIVSFNQRVSGKSGSNAGQKASLVCQATTTGGSTGGYGAELKVNVRGDNASSISEVFKFTSTQNYNENRLRAYKFANGNSYEFINTSSDLNLLYSNYSTNMFDVYNTGASTIDVVFGNINSTDSGVEIGDVIYVKCNTSSSAGVYIYPEYNSSDWNGTILLPGELAMLVCTNYNGTTGDPTFAIYLPQTTGASNYGARFNERGGTMIKIQNRTGGNSIKGYAVRADGTYDFAARHIIVDVPNPIGVCYESGVPNGSYMWITISGPCEAHVVPTSNNTVYRDNLVRGFVTGDSNYVSGKLLSEAIPSSPFATDKHFYEIGHTMAQRTGEGLVWIELHKN